MTDEAALEEVLDVWVGPGDVPAREKRTAWFRPPAGFDDKLRERFGALLERAGRGELDASASTPRATLALVILLDQISRNVHRGTARAFANDPRALELVRRAIARGDDTKLSLHHRSLLYMPMMHAEDLAAQDEGVRAFEALLAGAADEDREGFSSGLEFAKRHRDVVARFGRFPHRNATLGRTSTEEELAHLAKPGPGF